MRYAVAIDIRPWDQIEVETLRVENELLLAARKVIATQVPHAIKMTILEERRGRRHKIIGEIEIVELAVIEGYVQSSYELEELRINRLPRPSPPPTLLQQFKTWWRNEWDEIRKITDSFH